MHIKCEVQHHRDIWEWGIYGLSGWGIKWVGKVHVCVFKTCAQKKQKTKKKTVVFRGAPFQVIAGMQMN